MIRAVMIRWHEVRKAGAQLIRRLASSWDSYEAARLLFWRERR